MSPTQHLRVERSAQGVVTVTFDSAGRKVNVFEPHLLEELASVVTDLERGPPPPLVLFRSGKPSGFLAGADLHWIASLASEHEAQAMLRVGQELFGRIEALPMPTVAVIHGPCLGGGLEFALACSARIARDDEVTRLGLPETQLGLIPGWGGTQRLPRLVGLPTAVEMICTGAPVTAREARRLGLVEALLVAEKFEDELAADVRTRLQPPPTLSSAASAPPVRKSGLLTTAGQWLRDRWVLGQSLRREWRRRHDNPARLAAVRAIAAGWRGGVARGLAAEREEFCRVLFDPLCREKLKQFFQPKR